MPEMPVDDAEIEVPAGASFLRVRGTGRGMMRWLAALLMLFSANTAFAQPGSSDEAERLSAIEFWKYSECVVKRDRWLVEKVLATRARSDEGRALTRKLAEKNSACVSAGQLRMSGNLLRNALAAALVRDSFEGKPKPELEAVPPLYSLADLPENAPNKRVLRVGMHQFAECVARAAPEKALALLATEPYSDGESVAFGDLQPTMGPCLPVTAGTKLGFTRLELRTLLGKVLYQLTISREELEAA